MFWYVDDIFSKLFVVEEKKFSFDVLGKCVHGGLIFFPLVDIVAKFNSIVVFKDLLNWIEFIVSQVDLDVSLEGRLFFVGRLELIKKDLFDVFEKSIVMSWILDDDFETIAWLLCFWITGVDYFVLSKDWIVNDLLILLVKIFYMFFDCVEEKRAHGLARWLPVNGSLLFDWGSACDPRLPVFIL